MKEKVLDLKSVIMTVLRKKKKADKYFIRKNKMTYIKISPYDVLSYWLALKHYDVLRYCRKSHLLLIQLNEKSL